MDNPIEFYSCGFYPTHQAPIMVGSKCHCGGTFNYYDPKNANLST